jgi:hypothetical protein
VGPIELLDQPFDALPHFPRRPLQPPREVHVVLRLELLDLRFEEVQLTIEVDSL